MRFAGFADLVLLVGLTALPGLAQSGRTVTHSEKGLTHTMLIPEGYEEVWWQESANKAFGDEARAFQASMGTKSDSFAVLVRKRDLKAYRQGGPHPMQGHYVYISWSPQGRMPTAAQTVAEISRAGGSPDRFREATKRGDQATRDLFQKFLSTGSVLPLGILREWSDGYVASMAVGMQMVVEGQRIKAAKILNLGHQKRNNGYYVVSCVTLQEYGTKLEAQLDRTMAIANSLNNRPTSN